MQHEAMELQPVSPMSDTDGYHHDPLASALAKSLESTITVAEAEAKGIGGWLPKKNASVAI